MIRITRKGTDAVFFYPCHKRQVQEVLRAHLEFNKLETIPVEGKKQPQRVMIDPAVWVAEWQDVEDSEEWDDAKPKEALTFPIPKAKK